MAASARALALELLLRTEAARQYANLSLDAALSREQGLSAPDRSLVTTLFYGVIEHRITLDAVIDGLSSISPSAIERRVRMILRLALYQLRWCDRIPDHAAINEAVALTPRRSKGFVNAVLRSFCRRDKALILPCRAADPIGYLSVRYSVSPALAERFCAIFGAARAEAVLEAFSHTPRVTVRVNTKKLSREEFLARVEGAQATKHAPFGVHLPENAPLHALLDQGLCFVQDEASQICVAALDPKEGERVLDLCAAPGSKSFGAALTMGDRGAVHSFDQHANKISLIERGAARLGLSSVTAAAADARNATPETVGVFDTVLADVPCSGYGVLAKKPDIRYKSVEEAAGLLPVQAAILDAAASCVRVGGTLVYSTCTLLPEENEEQVRAFLSRHPDFALTPFTVGGICADGMLTLTPELYGTDGFFIAKLRRNI